MLLLFYNPSIYSVKKVQDSQIRLEMIGIYQPLFCDDDGGGGGGGGGGGKDIYYTEHRNLLDATRFI
jgi:hypothetical protein